MRQDKIINTEEKRDNDYKANVIQIILKHEMIYFVKLALFVLIVFTVWIRVNMDGCEKILISTKDFVGCLTFTCSTMIDCFVLARSISFSIKGKINIIHFAFCILLLACSIFLALIFINKIAISETIICIANGISCFCCVSPIVEFFYDTSVNIENENKKNY